MIVFLLAFMVSYKPCSILCCQLQQVEWFCTYWFHLHFHMIINHSVTYDCVVALEERDALDLWFVYLNPEYINR